MKESPLISVIIPCYNQGKYISEAIESILKQSYLNWECIVVNDGSSDNTKNIALKYANAHSNIKYVEQSNRGLSAARNRGLDESKGEFIQFLDSDDLIAPEKLWLQYESLSCISGLKLSYCDYYYCDERDIQKEINKGYFPSHQFVMSDPLRDLVIRWENDLSIPPHCFLFDSRFFHEHHIRFDEELPNHEDWDCWMKIFALTPIVTFIPKQLAIYRFHNDSMTRQREKMGKGFILAVKKQQKYLKKNKEIRKLLRKQIIRIRQRYRIESKIVKARKSLFKRLKKIICPVCALDR